MVPSVATAPPLPLPWPAAVPVGGMARRLAPFLALWLLLQMAAPWSWDRDRMVAAGQRLGGQGPAGVVALQATIASAQSRPEAARLQAINRLFNERIVFAEDIDTAGQVDHWSSPIELLARGAGDCEDYAIAKYFSLIAAGVPSARLRMVYVKADLGGSVRAHMVLAYYPQPNAEPLILDNLDPEIRPAAARRDLSPVFSFNAEGLWQGTGAQAAGDPVARLSRWRDVLAKARAEGFV